MLRLWHADVNLLEPRAKGVEGEFSPYSVFSLVRDSVSMSHKNLSPRIWLASAELQLPWCSSMTPPHTWLSLIPWQIEPLPSTGLEKKNSWFMLSVFCSIFLLSVAMHLPSPKSEFRTNPEWQGRQRKNLAHRANNPLKKTGLQTSTNRC